MSILFSIPLTTKLRIRIFLHEKGLRGKGMKNEGDNSNREILRKPYGNAEKI